MIKHLFKKPTDERSLTNIVNTMLRDAIRHGASHIIFDPHYQEEPDIFLVNFKIKDEMHLWLGIPKWILGEIVSHLRSMAGMKPSDENGIIEVRMKDQKHGMSDNYDLRVEIIPTPEGQQVALTFENEEILNS